MSEQPIKRFPWVVKEVMAASLCNVELGVAAWDALEPEEQLPWMTKATALLHELNSHEHALIPVAACVDCGKHSRAKGFLVCEECWQHLGWNERPVTPW